MTILSAKDKCSRPLSAAQIEKDRAKLEEQHERALKEDATWSMFGGVITIQGRSYQVL
jgi:hypothetical protein